MTGDDTVHRGSGDFLRDQGIEDPDEFRVKTWLCHEIAAIAEARKLTSAAIAALTGRPEADVVRVVAGRHDGHDLWRLMTMLAALGADILITVADSGHERGTILGRPGGGA